MTEIQNPKQYNLEGRTLEFARKVRNYVRILLKDVGNIEDAKQLVRSSGSIAANYIEANESLSKKDFVMRVKICRKEAKESILWLKLTNPAGEAEKLKLIQECTELMKIFGAILEKCK